MNGNQVVAALNAENRRLRDHIVQMQKDVGQGKFMEDLVCAALTGVVQRGIDPKIAANVAIDYAEAVLQEIVTRISKASGEAPEAEGEVATP